MPLHMGHVTIMRFAESFAGDLTVVVDKVAGEAPSSHVRAGWVRNEMPNATVVALDVETPQAPDEHPDFWNYWASLLFMACDGPVDILVAETAYGQRLADALGAEFIPFDIHKSAAGVRATQIRQNPAENWDSIAPSARPYYLKKVQVLGPESCGKSVLCRELASVFQTSFVPEFAQEYLEVNNGVLPRNWPELFLHGQACSEQAVYPLARRVCFCDSSSVSTLAWCELLGVPAPACSLNNYDLTLVCQADIPWVPDAHRKIVGPELRDRYMEILLRLLRENNIDYQMVSGVGKARLDLAARLVQGIVS